MPPYKIELIDRLKQAIGSRRLDHVKECLELANTASFNLLKEPMGPYGECLLAFTLGYMMGKGAVVQAEYLPIVQELVDRGADVKARDELKQTPLHVACQVASVPAVQLLCTRRADINAQDKYGRTPLMVAANPVSDVGCYLISLGADLRLVDSSGGTVFHWWCCRGIGVSAAPHFQVTFNEKTIEFLLQYWPEGVNQQDDTGQTPIACALYCDCAPVVKFLAEKGVRVTRQHLGDRGLLPMALLQFKLFPALAYEVVECLLQHGAQAEINLPEGECELTPIQLAFQAGLVEVAGLLIDAGANTAISGSYDLERLARQHPEPAIRAELFALLPKAAGPAP